MNFITKDIFLSFENARKSQQLNPVIDAQTILDIMNLEVDAEAPTQTIDIDMYIDILNNYDKYKEKYLD